MGHREVDRISVALSFPALESESGSRVDGVRILVDIDEKDPRVAVKIFGGPVSGVGVRVEDQDPFQAEILQEVGPGEGDIVVKAEPLAPIGFRMVKPTADADRLLEFPA